ncbi:hypothetical protein XHC_3835 [Xanthomonas hortorum pv. carotae str. M081]|nr:hypothetical protein XHC_3835 [Xanthomonas hortorum pv. carotae str. M081]
MNCVVVHRSASHAHMMPTGMPSPTSCLRMAYRYPSEATSVVILLRIDAARRRQP